MRALVCAGQGVGNIIMATPTMAAVASMGYTVDVHLFANYPDTADLIREWDKVADVYVGDDLPKRRYDAVIRTCWHKGRSLGLGPEYTPDGYDFKATHEADAHLIGARRLGFIGPIPETHVETGYTRIPSGDDYLVCAPGYSTARHALCWKRKAWPHWAGFCENVRRLTPNCKIVALGSKVCAGAWNGEADYEFFGTLTLKQAAGLIQNAFALVSVDNGLAHIGGALDVPTFVLFGGTSEIKNRPLGDCVTIIAADMDCRPCQMTKRWDDCANWKCMSELTPEMVLIP